MNTTKLAKTCNTTRKVVKAVRILSYIAIALFVFVTVISAFSLGGPIAVENEETGEIMGVMEIMTMGSYAVSALIIGSVVMRLCEKVLATVNTESTPFVSDNVKRIKTVAVLVAATSVVPSFISQIVNFILGGTQLLLEVELTMLVIALVIWCVALIFEYGVSLQEREDETL